MKKRVYDNILIELKKTDNQAVMQDVLSLVSIRDTIARFEPAESIEADAPDPLFPLIKPKNIGVEIKAIKPENFDLPENIKAELIDFCVSQLGLKSFIAASILDYFLEQRAYFCPLKTALKPGQLVWIGASFRKAKSIGFVKLKRPQVPIVLTLYDSKELNNRPTTLHELNSQMSRQLARITTEAYLQETLLAGDELQLFYLRAYTVLGKLIRKYMQENKVILPTPGSIMDAGTMFTHKELIIDLAMKVYYTKEIAKMTYHDPRSVDAYLSTFNSVLLLWYFEVTSELIAMVTGKGKNVVEQYIEIIKKYFPNNQAVVKYLKTQKIEVLYKKAS